MKGFVISVLVLGCFLMMANLAPSLLTSTRPDDEPDPRKLSNDQMMRSIAALIGMAVALTLVLHYWR
ncbi:hypothetical protein [Endozoicomonas sp. YOMI1]|uniref:hypothetical protein n=1 Tax=Endozoicomonas sp. YOMI1 TaxID=2828739 RepID=UPI002147A156|nr:hypothetical protein [Endozoicomonas sp. YOMI1]